MSDEHAQIHQAPDLHRRRASYLYGLIVSGAVLAAASESYRISRVVVAMVATLVIYWASETYVHWIAAREVLQRSLTPQERRHIMLDGWPLVTASAVPAAVLLVEPVAGRRWVAADGLIGPQEPPVTCTDVGGAG